MFEFLKSSATREDVILALELIVEGNDHVFGDFTDVPIKDPELDSIRQRVLALESSHPPGPDDYDVNSEGRQIILEMIQALRIGRTK